MMEFERRVKARSLLTRAGVSDETISLAVESDSMLTAIEVVADLLAEQEPPDETWWREKFLFTGEHMVETDDGWIPAAMNTAEVCGDEGPSEVLDEVNAPAK